MTKHLHILMVEDNESDIFLLQRTLEKGGYKISCEVVDTPGAMRSAINRKKNWDVITSDHSMLNFSSNEALALAKELCPEVPFIILSGEIDINLAVTLMKSGAHDYIQKKEMAIIVPAIERALKERELLQNQKRTSLALFESENRFQEVLENSLVASYKRNLLTSAYDYFSPVITQINGYTPEDMNSFPLETVFSLFHPEDLAETNRLVSESLSGNLGPAISLEYRFKHKAGHYVWLEDKYSVMRDNKGTPIALIGSVSDITERKNLEQAIQAEKTNLEEAQQIARIGSWKWDMVLNKVDWSKEMYRIYDIDPDTYDGKPESLIKVILPDDLDIFTNSMNTNLETGNAPSLEYRVIHKDGSIHTIHAEGKVEFDPSGIPIRSIGTVQDISERKLVEEILRESEANLKKAQKYAHLGSWVWNIKTNQLDWSEEMFHIFGINKDTFTGNLEDVIAAAIHPEDKEKVDDSNRSVVEQGKPIPLEYRIIRPDGTIRVVWAEAGELICDENGVFSYLKGTVQDITDRKQAEEALRESEEKYKVLHESAGVGIGYYSPDGKVISYNNLAAHNMGGKPEDFTRKSIYELFPRAAADIYMDRIQKAVFSAEIQEYEDKVELPGDQKWFSSTYTRILNSSQQVMGVQIISSDITKRKEEEELLRENEELFRTMFESSIAGISMVRVDGKFLKINDTICAMLGYTREELLQKKFNDLTYEDDKGISEKYHSQLLSGKTKSVNFEKRYVRKDGNVIWVFLSISAIRDKDDKIRYFATYTQEITERKRE